jgi:hypothetical protein
MNVKNKCYQNFPMELLFIQNIHSWGLHTLYLIRRFLLRKPMQFINSPLKSIKSLITLACQLVAMVSWYQKKFSVGSHISPCGVFGLVLMCHNSSRWFSVGCIVYDSIFSITSSYLFFSPQWKVTTSSSSFLGCSSCYRLFMWPTLALSCKTCSIIFFIFLLVVYCKWLQKSCNLHVILVLKNIFVK